jgi:hypothetical protein
MVAEEDEKEIMETPAHTRSGYIDVNDEMKSCYRTGPLIVLGRLPSLTNWLQPHSPASSERPVHVAAGHSYPAPRRNGDQGTDIGYGLGLENDAAGLDENRGFHPGHRLTS